MAVLPLIWGSLVVRTPFAISQRDDLSIIMYRPSVSVLCNTNKAEWSQWSQPSDSSVVRASNWK